MTTLEMIFTIILWIILGLFISHKCNFYRDLADKDKRDLYIFGNVMFSPLVFIVTIIRYYFIEKWKN